ncbi:hypothetical protein JCM10450v2_006042 [Rhodotorula kratochvilovae]
MPPKTKSTTSKAASSSKGALGFGSSKKGVSSAAAKGKKGSLERQNSGTPVKEEEKLAPSTIAGLYPRLYRESKKRMGKPIHADEMDDIEIILRVFDADEEYGPCSRISRLERFERAEKLGLNPDPEIGEILRSEDGQTRKTYSQSVFQI